MVMNDMFISDLVSVYHIHKRKCLFHAQVITNEIIVKLLTDICLFEWEDDLQ